MQDQSTLFTLLDATPDSEPTTEVRAKKRPGPAKGEGKGGRPREPFLERFWKYVNKHGPIPSHRPDLGPCWEWTGTRIPTGYGQIGSGGRDGKMLFVHRVAYEMVNGPLAPGEVVAHACDNPPCLRNGQDGQPSHLFKTNMAGNSADMVAKDRQAKGDRHGSVLHPESVARGERHSSKTHPESVARGDRTGARKHPESVPRGEKSGASKITEDMVREIRRRVANGERRVAIGKDYGIARNTVDQIMRGESWKHVE